MYVMARRRWSMPLIAKQGINMQDIIKLKAAAITTVSGVNMTTRRQMLKLKVLYHSCLYAMTLNLGSPQGMSEAKVEKIKPHIRCSFVELAVAGKPRTYVYRQGSSFATGLEMQDKRKRVLALSTGSKSVDAMLGGGIMSQSITEVYGEYRTGKTQLAHTLSVIAQLPPELGGASGKVAYIDTEGTFRPDRIRSIAERFGVNGDMVLENILYARAFNSEHQVVSYEVEAGRLCIYSYLRRWSSSTNALFASRRTKTLKSCIMALFRVDFSGRGELSERQQKMLSKLTKLSEEFNVGTRTFHAPHPNSNACPSVFEVLGELSLIHFLKSTADPGATMTFVAGGALKPIGGHIISHASATRIFLRKGILARSTYDTANNLPAIVLTTL
ncbi:hypothetical protein HETIRDRAFT_413401 [Heterobasidion irregulare TC 32-1]|uniref:RecA family profile 1 domain-containing protein n=1 Tax=Heterobasidion irregulare (strain TC 32-1) TaxID=747525 RepID=W4KML2_HETIT|nr:uncharacterized protein HETIRDRAFT_413401 [Heterobasidion irregulare TC 32-1]ETW87057.1 hypothetical protein HETIRDRAFT_413401 [Heterobasidion irregulare TC 32-1]